jgi:predicted DNA-binding protein
VKPKISVHLSEQVAERLTVAAKRDGVSKTAIIEAAISCYLEQKNDTSDSAALLRLNWMSRQLEKLDRDLKIVCETVALHVRYHLTVTPPLSSGAHRAACVLGSERFEVLAAQVGRRVHLGTPLMRETIDRLSVTSPDLFAHEVDVGAPHSAQSAESEPSDYQANERDAALEVLAAVGEDGSSGGFPRTDHTSVDFGERKRDQPN